MKFGQLTTSKTTLEIWITENSNYFMWLNCVGQDSIRMADEIKENKKDSNT